jgi:formyl-CoA transferase
VAIAVFDDDQWRALVACDGLEALRNERFATAPARRAHEAEIDAILDEWTAIWDKHELAEYLQRRGVPAGPFQTIDDMIERDPTLGERHFARVQHPSGREFLVHRNPLEMRRSPTAVDRGPQLGEHTFFVLHDVLGMSEEEIAEAVAEGAVE